MRIPLERQRALYDQYSESALSALVVLLQSRGEQLRQLGRERAFESVGVHEYGDSTYWLSDEQLQGELDAELADAIFYLQVVLARRAGELPVPEPG